MSPDITPRPDEFWIGNTVSWREIELVDLNYTYKIGVFENVAGNGIWHPLS